MRTVVETASHVATTALPDPVFVVESMTCVRGCRRVVSTASGEALPRVWNKPLDTATSPVDPEGVPLTLDATSKSALHRGMSTAFSKSLRATESATICTSVESTHRTALPNVVSNVVPIVVNRVLRTTLHTTLGMEAGAVVATAYLKTGRSRQTFEPHLKSLSAVHLPLKPLGDTTLEGAAMRISRVPKRLIWLPPSFGSRFVPRRWKSNHLAGEKPVATTCES